MDQSTPSSKKKSKIENDSFEKKGLSDCESAPNSDVSSFYEINVHENFSSESNSSKGSSHFYVRPKLMVKVKKIGGNKEDKENNHSTQSFVENFKKIANPLIESYYPFLEDHQVGNITIEVNVSPVNPDGKESGKNSGDEKSGEISVNNSWNKSNENTANDNQEVKEEKKMAINSFIKMRKKIKRQIIQDMLTKKDGEFKDVQWKDVEKDQLHIHHHEHHHHYYMDAAKMKDESEFSLLQVGSHSPVHWSEDKEKTGILNAEFNVKGRERSNYLYCSRQHPVNFLMGKNSCNISNSTFVKSSKEECTKIAEKYLSRIPLLKPLKKASSMDSLTCKKSDFIVFHNYSDTEVSKCDSEEGSFTDVPSSRSVINVNRNMTKSTKTEHKWSKLWEERDVVTESDSEVNDSNCSDLKKSSDEKYEKTSTEMQEINKKSENRSDLFDRLKTLEKNDEGSRGEFEILVSKKIKKSVDESKKGARSYFTRPVRTLSSEGEPVDIITDKETSAENVKSTCTVTTSTKDTGTLFEISEDGSCRSREKCSRRNTPKSAENSRDKMRTSTRKKIDSNDQVALKSNQTFGTSGNSKSKGKIADLALSTAENSDQYLDSRKVSLQFWSQKLRQELKDIKKELRSLEKKHMRGLIENRLTQIRASCPDEYYENGISVYSSRTYIVGANHFKLVNALPRKRDFRTSFKNRNMFTQKQITYLYSSPKTSGWGGVEHTESKFSTKEKGFYWNQHFVSRKRKEVECVQNEKLLLQNY